MNILKITMVFVAILLGTTGFSQSKYKEINFKVEGNCGMCEKRIENALDVKGIKLADWDVKSKNCRVIFHTGKYSEKQIHQIIADVGHTTESVKTTEEAYNKLHGCCKY